MTHSLVLSEINATSVSCSTALPVYKLPVLFRVSVLFSLLPLGRLHLPGSHLALSFFALLTLLTCLAFVTQATLYELAIKCECRQ